MISATANAHSLENDRFFEPLKDYLISTTGLSYYEHRNGDLADRIERRLKDLDVSNCLSYLQILESGLEGQEELDRLIEDLTIGETYFFRHPDLFAALEETILPDIIKRNAAHRRLRIWSAGSSIGAEAYTLSILLRRRLEHLTRGWDVTILGTDINRSFLSYAAKAKYEEWALRSLSDEFKQQCFSHCGKIWTLDPQYQDGVSFQYHNLARHPFPSMLHNLFAFDLILCRNVMIYFSRQVTEGIVDNMRRCLVDGGWLLVGHAEHNLALFRDFRVVNFDGATAYQRSDGSPNAKAGLRPPKPICATAPAPPLRLRNGRPKPHAAPSRHRADGPAAAHGIDPSAALANVRRLADRGEIETAAEKCRQLLQTQKLDPTCHLYHALILEQLSEHASCEQALRRAIYLDRDFVLAHYYLGLTLQRLGRRIEAVRSFRNVRRLLDARDRDCVIENSDHMTAAELDELTRMQLEAIES